MKGVLIIKESNFQIYCANNLFQAGVIENVVVENGRSFPPPNLSMRTLLASPIRIIQQFLKSKNDGLRQIKYYLNYISMFGNVEIHNKSILKNKYQKFDQKLKVLRVKRADLFDSLLLIQAMSPDIIFVFGTGLLSQSFIEAFKVPKINMHWGWSPTYRGDGIFPALAMEGSKGLGVTIHKLSEKADAGDIISRHRIKVESCENIYSIGLRCTKVGTEVFIRLFEQYNKTSNIPCTKQQLEEGQYYTSKYLREHSELIEQGWLNLRQETSNL